MFPRSYFAPVMFAPAYFPGPLTALHAFFRTWGARRGSRTHWRG